MTLPEDGFLHLEVAEDYATLVSNTLNAVQVKATKAAITLNTKSVINAIDAFFLLRERNSGRQLTMEYLTTAEIGVEAELADRVRGEAGINYWLSASKGADVGPLKARLLQLPLSAAAKDFLSKASDQTIREDLLARLRWRYGEPGIVEVRQRLLDQAGAYCIRESEPVAYADRFVDKLVGNIIEAVVAGDRRGRTKVDLVKAFQEVTRVSVRASVLDTILRPGLVGQSAGLSLVEPPAVDPLPNAFINVAGREYLVEGAISCLSESGVSWFHAGAGYGKTTLATLVARRTLIPWSIARFRGTDAAFTASKLRRVATEIEMGGGLNVLLDDIDHLSIPSVQEAISVVLATRHRLSSRLMMTSSQPPARMRLRQWFGTGSVTVSVPDFTEQEIKDLIAAEGGPPETFGRYVYLGSDSGHPQLAHALILGLKDRAWPVSEVDTLAALSGSDVDVERVRGEIRSRLVSELPTEQLNLLCRLTLVFGTFSRQFALSLAEKAAPIALPGIAFDGLHGPWIDQVAGQKFRPSSLVTTLGRETLGPGEVKNLNAEIARLRIEGGRLDAAEVDGITVNALLGEADDVLEVVFAATISSDKTDLPRLVDAFPTLLAMSPGKPLYQKSPTIAAKLRMIQVLLLGAKGSAAGLKASLEVLDNELLLLSDPPYANTLRISTLSKLMFQPGVIDILPGVMSRLAALRNDPSAAAYAASMPEVSGQRTSIDFMVRAIFASQLSSVRRVSTISRLLDEISALPEGDQTFFLSPFVHHPGDKAVAVKAPWSAGVMNGVPGTEQLAFEYIALAKKAVAIGDAEIASAAYETAATIYDEDLKRPDAALDVLNIAVDNVPDYRWSLIRHRTRVLFHMERYQEQLDAATPLLPGLDRPNIEMAYFLREIAIACSYLEQHGEAADYYASAAARALASELPDMKLMALGLRADEAIEAFWAGNGERAVTGLSAVLIALEQVDVNAGLRQKALWSYIPHTVAWMVNNAIPGVTDPGFEYAMTKGLNSNPNPDQAIAQLRRGPIAFVWAMLAEIEARLKVDAGVGTGMLSSEWDTRIPTLADYTLRRSLLMHSFMTGNVEGFVESLPGIVASVFWLNNAPENLDPFNSPVGRVPVVADAELRRFSSFTASRALSFLVALALQGHVERVDDFMELHNQLSSPMLLPEQLEAFETADILDPSNDAESSLAGILYHHFKDGRTLTPNELFIIGVRIVEMSSSDVTGCLKTMGFDWYLTEWRRVSVEQRFLITSPSMIDTTIEAVVSLGKNGVAGVAAAVLAFGSHVNVDLSASLLVKIRSAAGSWISRVP